MLLLSANKKNARKSIPSDFLYNLNGVGQISGKSWSISKSSQKNSLFRIMSVYEFISMLRSKSLSFSDPRFWIDDVDSRMMHFYDEHKPSKKKTYALCLTKQIPSALMWQVYGNSPYSICVHFDKPIFENALEGMGRTLVDVTYDADKKDYKGNHELYPYVKRSFFEPEQEARVLSETEKMPFGGIDFNALIKHVMISPFAKFEMLQEILIENGIPKEKIKKNKIFRDDDFLKAYCPNEFEFKKETENA